MQALVKKTKWDNSEFEVFQSAC